MLVFGIYLSTIELPVWVGNEYEPMHVFLPLGFLLWILSVLFLVCGIVLGMKKLSAGRWRTVFTGVGSVVGLTLSVLALVSVLFPWVLAESAEPLVETRAGIFDVGKYHALTGLDLVMGISKVDEIFLVFGGAIIGILHVPLVTLLGKKRIGIMRASLFLLSGVCILSPVPSVYAQTKWWIDLRVDGALAFSVTFENPGAGLLVAASCAIVMISYGIITASKLVRQNPLLRTGIEIGCEEPS